MSGTSRPIDSFSSSRVFHELDDVLDACAVLARHKQTPDDFYRQVAEHVTHALAARGVCVWLPSKGITSTSRLQAVVATGLFAASNTSDARNSIEKLVAAAGDDQVTRHDVVELGPVIIVPVSPRQWLDEAWLANAADAGRGWACLAIALPEDWPPSTYRAVDDFCQALAGVAAEFHARAKLVDAAGERRELQGLADIAQRAGRSLQVREVAEVIANEGRRLLECDRLSVHLPRGDRARLVATSGLEQFDRKSRAVRDMQSLAAKCLRWKSAIAFGASHDDSPPELDVLLAAYADAHEVRGLTAIPVTLGNKTDQPIALLLAEQFTAEAEPIAPHRVQELAETVAPALFAATSFERIPLAGALGQLSALRQPSAMGKWLLTLTVVASIAATLMFVQRPLRVRATGQIIPIERSHVFAPHDGIVESIQVAHGSQVSQGDVLLVLRDPALEAERTRLAGERATFESQLETLRSTRLSLAADRTKPVELYRLSAEEATIEHELASLAERESQLNDEIESLTIRSPRDGRVLTWQVEEQLATRPVERGQELLLVADTQSGWQLELDLPDRELGYVQHAIGTDMLKIEYQLAADEREFRKAELLRVADRAQQTTDSLGNTTTTIELVAAPSEQSASDELQAAALRPGSHVRARLDCGNRSLGYVLFHKLSRRLVEWWQL